MAFSPEGPAGASSEFTDDINAICAIHHRFRAVHCRRKLDGKEKLGCPGRICDWDN
jgi:hypothetical protein